MKQIYRDRKNKNKRKTTTTKVPHSQNVFTALEKNEDIQTNKPRILWKHLICSFLHTLSGFALCVDDLVSLKCAEKQNIMGKKASWWLILHCSFFLLSCPSFLSFFLLFLLNHKQENPNQLCISRRWRPTSDHMSDLIVFDRN